MINREELSALFDNTEVVESPVYSKIPDGKYSATLDYIRLATLASGSPVIETCFSLVGGDMAGRKVFNNFFLSQAAIPYVKRTFDQLGFGGIPFNDYEKVVYPQMLSSQFEITLKTKAGQTDRQNVYINKMTALSDSVLPSDGFPF